MTADLGVIDGVRSLSKLGAVTICLIAASGLVVASAPACTLPWSRTPNDQVHYFTGGLVDQSTQPFPELNGANADIWTSSPTVRNTFSGGWVGMVADGQVNNQTVPVLVQDGYLDTPVGGDETFYEICGNTTCYWQGTNVQNVTVGSFYNFNVYFQGGKAYFQFAGVLKNTVQLSQQGITGIDDNTNWDPQAEGEIGTYSDQMPGTSSNNETWTHLESRRWCGSSTCWDTSSDQAWGTSGHDLGQLFTNPFGDPGHVSQSRINASFKNSYTTISGIPEIEAYDTCSTS